MGTALSAVRARLQILLDDAAAAVWTTAELDEHIQAALRDLSLYIPREQKTTIATTNGSREVSVAALADRVTIEAVEYKTGNDPRTFAPFAVWGDTLTLESDAVPDGSNCAVYWTSLHTINGSQTLATRHDEALTLGAAWHACEQQAADATNSLNTGGASVTRDWGAEAQSFRSRYERRRNRARGIRVRAITAADQPQKRQQSTDPGP